MRHPSRSSPTSYRRLTACPSPSLWHHRCPAHHLIIPHGDGVLPISNSGTAEPLRNPERRPELERSRGYEKKRPCEFSVSSPVHVGLGVSLAVVAVRGGQRRVLQPTILCVPVNVSGQPLGGPDLLTCYRTYPPAKQERFDRRDFAVEHELDPQVLDVYDRADLLCVPPSPTP